MTAPTVTEGQWEQHAEHLRRARRPVRNMTTCDRCGDWSNSAPDLMCGRVEPESWDGPCPGTYRLDAPTVTVTVTVPIPNLGTLDACDVATVLGDVRAALEDSPLFHDRHPDTLIGLVADSAEPETTTRHAFRTRPDSYTPPSERTNA